MEIRGWVLSVTPSHRIGWNIGWMPVSVYLITVNVPCYLGSGGPIYEGWGMVMADFDHPRPPLNWVQINSRDTYCSNRRLRDTFYRVRFVAYAKTDKTNLFGGIDVLNKNWVKFTSSQFLQLELTYTKLTQFNHHLFCQRLLLFNITLLSHPPLLVCIQGCAMEGRKAVRQD